MLMLNDTVPVLRGPHVTLRRPQAEDVEVRHAIGRHPEVVRAYGGTFDPAESFTRGDAEREVMAIQAEPLAWVIDLRGFIGQIRFHSLVWADRRAAMAIGIEDPGQHGQGFGTEAIRLALAYGFGAGLHRVSVRVLASNGRAIRCYRRCGFKEEGRERESAYVAGHWQDDIVMGLIDREFETTS